MTSGALKTRYNRLGFNERAKISWAQYKEQNKHLLDTTASSVNIIYPNTWAISGCNCSTCVYQAAEEDMESSMNTIDVNAAPRNDLLKALERFEYNTSNALHKKYIVEPDAPKTASAIIEAIKSGNITVPKKEDEKKHKCDPYKGIIWAKDWKADEETFEKKTGELKTTVKALRLDIKILEPTETLKKFRDLEGKYEDLKAEDVNILW